MNQWGNRNGQVGELIDLLERLQLFRPRDVILGWASGLKFSSSPPLPTRSFLLIDPPPKEFEALPTLSTCKLSTTVDKGGGRPLPGPAPPPSSLQSDVQRPPQPLHETVCNSSAVMCWSYEEVHAGTLGFSPSRKVGEGGFGVVYRASLSNIDCAIKKLKQDSPLDWTLLKESFKTEVEKLSKFRHVNIVDLWGFSEGGGSMCLIYSFMENQSLEDQLHKECAFLSWPQRVSIVEGAAAALKFLHFPPGDQTPLIHGDVKSSNILLDRYLVAKLSDFGLARFVSRGSAVQSASVGKTATVRGTLAYLPDEYVRNGELGTAVDVYSFGVVMLEVLTGRRALEKDKKSGDRYLKDLVEEVEDGPTCSSAAAWMKQLDERLIAGGTAEPAGCLQVVALACRTLDRNRKKRPYMTEVFEKLQDIHNLMKKTSSPPLHLRHPPFFQPHYQSFPRPPRSLDSRVAALSHQLSKLGPLEDTYQPHQLSSSFCSLTPPHPLHSSSSLPLLSSSSFVGPCEIDESRGFSQYNLRSQIRSNGTSCRSLSPSTTDQYLCPAESQCSQPSVPTEDQYNFSPQSSSGRSGALTGAAAPAGLCGFSPAGSLQSMCVGPTVHMNPSTQRLVEKKSQYEEGKIQSPELLSADDLYEGKSSVDFRGPEESDDLDYLPAKHH